MPLGKKFVQKEISAKENWCGIYLCKFRLNSYFQVSKTYIPT